MAAIQKAESEAKLTLIAAAQPAAMVSNALMVEDEFNPFYMTGRTAIRATCSARPMIPAS